MHGYVIESPTSRHCIGTGDPLICNSHLLNIISVKFFHDLSFLICLWIEMSFLDTLLSMWCQFRSLALSTSLQRQLYPIIKWRNSKSDIFEETDKNIIVFISHLALGKLHKWLVPLRLFSKPSKIIESA